MFALDVTLPLDIAACTAVTSFWNALHWVELTHTMFACFLFSKKGMNIR